MARGTLTQKGTAVNVKELLEILKDYPEDTEVELAIIAPVTDDDDDIAVDRYLIEGVMPWEDDDEEDGEEGGESVWLVGGENEDVEKFLDAMEDEEDDA
jgi:hypothetical protein